MTFICLSFIIYFFNRQTNCKINSLHLFIRLIDFIIPYLDDLTNFAHPHACLIDDCLLKSY